MAQWSTIAPAAERCGEVEEITGLPCVRRERHWRGAFGDRDHAYDDESIRVTWPGPPVEPDETEDEALRSWNETFANLVRGGLAL